MLMRLEQMKNKNYLRQKINYNNSVTEVMEGVTLTPEMFGCKVAFPFLFQNKINLHFYSKHCKPDLTHLKWSARVYK